MNPFRQLLFVVVKINSRYPYPNAFIFCVVLSTSSVYSQCVTSESLVKDKMKSETYNIIIHGFI